MDASTSKMARERWKLLANVLTKNNDDNTSLLNSVSVRRFQGFGLFKAVERIGCSTAPVDFQTFEYFSNVAHVPSSRVQITVRKKNVGLHINELSGFDNTGNICIWPSEEVLAYYLLKHKSKYEGKCVCELGAGMTALAGIMLAANCDVTEVYLTDGNQQSVENIRRIIARNNSVFGDTKVHARTMLWGENAVLPEIRNKFDLIVASDCLFYVKSHKDLLHTIDTLLSSKGHVILMSPSRTGTLQQFYTTASLYFEVQIIMDYDELVSAKLKEAQALGNDLFDEDLHYPVIVLLQRKQLNNKLKIASEQDVCPLG